MLLSIGILLAGILYSAGAIKYVDIPDDKALDPSAANGKWIIVDFTKCYTCAQSSRDTFRGGNGAEINDQLWFTGNRHAAEYWGCVKGCGLSSTVQGGIYSPYDCTNGIYTVVTVILPSGVEKLKRIDPDPYYASENDYSLEAAGAKQMAIFGINGDIADSDLAWANLFSVMQGVRARYNTGIKQYQ